MKVGIRKIFIISMLVVITMVLACCGNRQSTYQTFTFDGAETVEFENKEYELLSFPTNIFYYDYNGNPHDYFEEVDGIYPIDSPKWDMIWNGGDLYCIKNAVNKANRYYADDNNYVWYAKVDTDEEDDELNSYSVEVTKDELEYLYSLEDKEKELAVYFEEFEKLGSIFKISEDGVVRGTISVGKYNDKWYWRSEIIDESREKDDTWPEYVQPLPELLDSQIKECED